MIAMAIACQPDLLIADEPTTALDVTIQAQILEVLQTAAAKTGSSIILITHDLGVVAGLAERVAVMYAGQIVEQGTVEQVFYRPRMPYTWGLLDSIPRLDQDRVGRLRPIIGGPPNMASPPSGCRFHPRCPYAGAGLSAERAEFFDFAGGERDADLLTGQQPRQRCAQSLAGADLMVLPVDGVPGDDDEGNTLLKVQGLTKHYPIRRGILGRQAGSVRAVDGIGFAVKQGETFGLVGESGCGKSTTARMILKLIHATAGTVEFDHRQILDLGKRDTRALRRDMQIVFQDPYASLNPRMTVRQIVSESMVERPSPVTGSRSCCRCAGCGPNMPVATPTSSPEVSASASAWPGPSLSIRSWSCSTSRYRRSMCPSRPRSST